ncbi:MAG: Rrf2 family transcriptional regulator [Cryomorphaceae bacterium]|nr:Rrf2 family transcriptional regulator [Cryomorphaceae bacterium]
MFSKACEYGIRASVYIYLETAKNHHRLSIKDIAKEIDSPEPFTAKILQKLSRKGLISSVKGPGGGFYTSPEQENISLLEIVRAIDGDDLLTGCGLGLKNCSELHPCPLHDQYKVIRDGLVRMLRTSTVSSLSKDLKSGLAHLYNPKLNV